ncbi:biopolymer transporter ExbD [Brevundimonas sp.]|uniref:biopolymer transporter ExbD n=1 Tax=Brevundimonas sp. TaxID=1871086 RepID=UPI003F6F7837
MGARISGPAGQDGATVEQNADINVTPFVDIMLVLLIIFMVAAPIATVSLKLDLPPPVMNEQPPRDPVYVSVQEDGTLFLAEKQTSMERLAADVCAATGRGDACREERIFIRAQPEVRYDQFMAVMNGLKSSGFDQVGLLNEDID